MLIPEEPYLVYYCGMRNKQPCFHEASGLVKQMPLEEATKVYDAINPSSKEVNVCLIEWGKFAEVYQLIGVAKHTLMDNSLKSK